MNLQIVIPTFGREDVLVDSLGLLERLSPEPIILVDQTQTHEKNTTRSLEKAERDGRLVWKRLDQPNIPRAMNAGLRCSRASLVLFLDDDIVPSKGLLQAHLEAHTRNPGAWAVVGQILQPGQVPNSPKPGDSFAFHNDQPAWITTAMAGNLSVKREQALRVGGFDENFLGAAYMFEAEFSVRLLDAGGKIYFEPSASIQHLRAGRGGTRAHGHHLTTSTPFHSVGAHYYFLLRNTSARAAILSLQRLLRSIMTRHHLTHPWGIPITILAEIRGWFMARKLYLGGPQLLIHE